MRELADHALRRKGLKTTFYAAQRDAVQDVVVSKRVRTNVRERAFDVLWLARPMHQHMIRSCMFTQFSWTRLASDWDASMASATEVTAVG